MVCTLYNFSPKVARIRIELFLAPINPTVGIDRAPFYSNPYRRNLRVKRVVQLRSRVCVTYREIWKRFFQEEVTEYLITVFGHFVLLLPTAVVLERQDDLIGQIAPGIVINRISFLLCFSLKFIQGPSSGRTRTVLFLSIRNLSQFRSLKGFLS